MLALSWHKFGRHVAEVVVLFRDGCSNRRTDENVKL